MTVSYRRDLCFSCCIADGIGVYLMPSSCSGMDTRLVRLVLGAGQPAFHPFTPRVGATEELQGVGTLPP